MKTFQQFLESYLEPTLSECSVEDLEDFLMSEEFEQLDEISKKTLGSYIKKASIDASARMASTTGDAVRGVSFDRENSRKYGNRVRGVNKAVDRLTKEEFEQLDELSRGTLARYVQKAGRHVTNLTVKNKQRDADLHNISVIAHNSSPEVKKHLRNAYAAIEGEQKASEDKLDKRGEGIRLAAKRLSKD